MTNNTAQLYITVFNAVFSRRCMLLPQTSKRIDSWLKLGYKPWQIVAHPILVYALMSESFIRVVRPEMILRDGKNPRTTLQYGTCGGTDWLSRTWERADTVTLDSRLSSIAKAADEKMPGVLDGLKRAGVIFYD